jgi:hypothetical protein
MIRRFDNGGKFSLVLLKLSVLIALLLSACAKHPVAAVPVANKAGTELALHVFAEQPYQELVLKSLTCEFAALKDVTLTDSDHPTYFIYVSASEVKLAPPYGGPTGISLSVLITRPADRGSLWDMKKDASPEMHKEIVKALLREQFVVQHWQRGGDITILDKLSKSIVSDFDKEILEPERNAQARTAK